MNKSIFLAIAFIVVNFSLSNAQQKSGWVYGPAVGYQYQNGSFLKASAWGLFPVNPSQYLKVDVGANFTWMLDKTTVIPELGVTYYLNNVAIWPLIKAEVTPHTLTGKVGLGIFNLLELAAGYGLDINTKKDFKPIDGFTFSVGVNIPLKFNLY